MSRNFGYALAVPHALLDHWQAGEAAQLTIDAVAWRHLTAYLDGVTELPAQFGDGQRELQAAVGRLTAAVQRFGSPRQARALMRDLSSAPPAQADTQAAAIPPYPALVMAVGGLRDAATAVLRILREPFGHADARHSLASLGDIAATARARLQPVSEAFNGLRAVLTGANGEMAQAASACAARLQQAQEACGATEAQVASLESRIARLGIFKAHQKPELLQRLATLQATLATQRAHAEQLRQQQGVIELLLRDGAWLDAALEELGGFLDDARVAWTAFGSGVAQLAADASAAQLADAAFIDQRLERAAAIEQWAALADAAGRFAAHALSAAPATVEAKGMRP